MAKGDALRYLQKQCNVMADAKFGINTARAIAKKYKWSQLRAAHILGQCAHESGNFIKTEESTYYSTAKRIRKTWPTRFKTDADAQPYVKNPKALADKVYGGRMQNQGRGYFWRGRGFIQLTGATNYKSFAEDTKLYEVLKNPDLVATEYAMQSAIWFFDVNDLWDDCDNGLDVENIKFITKRINNGYKGLKDRIEKTNKIYNWLS